jgi:predicted RNA-binding protein (virulence factor B family)
LEVKATTPIGAFLDWGLDKDLLLPHSEQVHRVQKGEKVVVYMYVDQHSERLVATMKWQKFLRPNYPMEEKELVEIIVARKTDLGFLCVIEHIRAGLLYFNEVFEELMVGDVREAYIHRIRADGKIDLRLKAGAIESIGNDAEKIIAYLKNHDGSMEINDKSDPELIKLTFGMSKKAFKRAIGALYKSKEIDINETGVKLCS